MTTILALTYNDGVIMAGDRRATAGTRIASRDIDKIIPADAYSGIAISGSAGRGMELARQFQLELEHYEKIEGSLLSLAGKANRLGSMVRDNLQLAQQGLIVIPMFAGFDLKTGDGRIWSYDATGGRYEESDYYTTGSGGSFAYGALKKLWQPGLSESDAIKIAIEALYDAADDDSATGGPDLVRQIWPDVVAISADGYVEVPDATLKEVVTEIVGSRGEFEQSKNAPGQKGVEQ